MNIIQINTYSAQGSTGRTTREFANYINNHTEHSCYTVYSIGQGVQNGYRMGTVGGKKVHALLSRIFGLQAHFSTFSTAKMLMRLDKVHPDVIILRNIHSNFLNLPLVLRYLAKRDIPTIVVLDDCWYFTAKCSHYSSISCYKWKTGCHNCPRLRDDNPSWFFDRTPFLWNEKKKLFAAIPRLGVIGVSEWVTSEAKKSLLASAKFISNIYNWIDFSVFCPAQDSESILSGLPYDFKIMGVASKWSNSKGLSDFIKISKLLNKNECIILIGDLPSGVRLPSNIIAIGLVESEEMLARYYNAADVLLSLSAEETFGKVSAEALGCGTPIICMNATASPELCGEGCGFVCPVGDIDAVLRSIQIIETRGKSSFKEHCVTFARDRFSKERLINYWIDSMASLAGISGSKNEDTTC